MVAPYVLYAQDRHIRKAGLTLPSSQVHHAGQRHVSLLYLLWAARSRISVSCLLLSEALALSLSLSLSLSILSHLSLELSHHFLEHSLLLCLHQTRTRHSPNLPYPRFHPFNLFTIPTLL